MHRDRRSGARRPRRSTVGRVVGHVDQVATGEFVEPAEVRPVGRAVAGDREVARVARCACVRMVARAGAQLVPSDALDHIQRTAVHRRGPPARGG